jgi:sporulation protein YlmC with PRC-barrel domain
MRLSELMRCQVVTASGEKRGSVHDVRGEIREGRLVITGLVAGGLGLLERYGIRSAELAGPPGQRAHVHPVIPWTDVRRVETGAITVRDA